MEAPASGSYRLILSEDYVSTLFDFYKDKADAGYVYAGYSDYKIGDNVQADDDGKIAGDAITAEFKADVPFTSEGIRLIDRPFMDKGVLKTITGNARFSSYLGIEPTGVYDDLSVECGTTSVEEMKKKPYLHVVNFSDFQMDSFDGHFGGEIVHDFAEVVYRDVGIGHFDHHHHYEIAGKDCLGDVGDVDFVLCENGRHLCDNSNFI